jgi:hypothetical protein
MKFNKSYLKALPLTLLLLGMVLYKYRYTLKLAKPVLVEQEAIDSSYLYVKFTKPTVAQGYLMGRQFNGVDANKYPKEQSMDNGMDVINNDQFQVVKLYDEAKGMEVYIAIRDLTLLTKVPFSFAFENGTTVLVTAFVRNKSGVNVMYGGTIHNNSGKLRLDAYNERTGMVSGEVEADLEAVIENGSCDIRNLQFRNAILKHSKIE